jgi:DNA repair photolyase
MRWKLADDNGPQGALFDGDSLVDRHVGTGEFRGMEFLHVNAQRIINEVPAASRMPFRFTINAYRGCSHACSYCTIGDTSVDVASRSIRPIADLRVGDEIVGTEVVGNRRRPVTTQVLAHWETRKLAFRLHLANGTEIVTSRDHRLLTPDGWRAACGNDAAVHTVIARGMEDLRVVAIEPLGIDMPMYDITTGTGDFIANGVVSHNCFARPTHDYLGLNIGEDFEKRIVVKVNAVERVRAELAGRRWAGHPIAMGTNTDPYQRCEGKYHLTQGIVKVLSEARNPFSILTKSTLILRDIDLLRAAAERTDVHVALSIGTLDDEVWKLTEPGTPHPKRRVEAVRKLTDAGIRCGVLIAPIIPGMSDREDQIKAVAEACRDAGADSMMGIPLHLRPGVREHFFDWMSKARPDLLADYQRRYRRSNLPKAEQEGLTARIRRAIPKPSGNSTSHTDARDKARVNDDPGPVDEQMDLGL